MQTYPPFPSKKKKKKKKKSCMIVISTDKEKNLALSENFLCPLLNVQVIPGPRQM